MSLRLRFLALAAALVLASAAPSGQNQTLKSLMRVKLLNTERLLGATIGGDFAGMARPVNALSRISVTEVASWQVGASPEYRDQATNFVGAVQGLREAAESRDIDAALSEYSALVASCTRCHALVRRSRRAAL